jgi:hypothetical protein
MRFAAIAGLKNDGKIEGLGQGTPDQMKKKFRSGAFVGFRRVYYFENTGTCKSKPGKPAQPAQPKPAKPGAK